MLFSSRILLLLPLYLSGFAFAESLSGQSTNAVIPVDGINMGAIAVPTGLTSIFYQDATNNSIIQIITSGDFETGIYSIAGIIVPGDEVRSNSPVAVSVLPNASGDTWNEVRVGFFSPDNVLSEYYWTLDLGWNGGPTCTTCVTNKGFVAAAGSQMLYALATSGPIFRYGFVLDSGNSHTISEAVNIDGNGWSVATLTS